MFNLTCLDDYTKVILTQTLAFERNHARYPRDHAGRTFIDYLTDWMAMPHVVVDFAIVASDVEVDEETGQAVAREISWAWRRTKVEVLGFDGEPLMTYPRGAQCTGARPPANLADRWYDTKVVTAERPYLVGALINHGTMRAPRWGSHS